MRKKKEKYTPKEITPITFSAGKTYNGGYIEGRFKPLDNSIFTMYRNLRVVDMCIYIDNTLYERDKNNKPISRRELNEDETETVLIYLALCYYILSKKAKYFWEEIDYENFSVATALKIYKRLTSPTTNIKIQSILNYIKNTIYFEFIKFKMSEIDNIKEFESSDIYQEERTIDTTLKEKYEIDYLFDNLNKFIDKCVNKYSSVYDKVELYTLRMTVKLTILNLLKKDTKKLLKQLSKIDSLEIVYFNKSLFGTRTILKEIIIDIINDVKNTIIKEYIDIKEAYATTPMIDMDLYLEEDRNYDLFLDGETRD